MWLRANKILLNASKTEIVLFKSKNKSKVTKHLNFRISGQKIIPVSKVKYLGILLDEHLNFNDQFQQLYQKLNRATGMLAKIRHYVPTNTLLNIYYSIFQSNLIYGCQVWGQNANALKRVSTLLLLYYSLSYLLTRKLSPLLLLWVVGRILEEFKRFIYHPTSNISHGCSVRVLRFITSTTNIQLLAQTELD